jgi:hypothetical protein
MRTITITITGYDPVAGQPLTTAELENWVAGLLWPRFAVATIKASDTTNTRPKDFLDGLDYTPATIEEFVERNGIGKWLLDGQRAAVNEWKLRHGFLLLDNIRPAPDFDPLPIKSESAEPQPSGYGRHP